jgi:hypothetical protein
MTWQLREINLAGQRALVLDHDIEEQLPAHVKEGLARRRIVNSGGVCPCGARAVFPNRAQRRKAAREGRLISTTVEHEEDCPALLKGRRWTA